LAIESPGLQIRMNQVASGNTWLRKAFMDSTEAASVSEIFEPQNSNGNGNGNIHTLKPREDAYQAAYEAGLAIGKEAGYRRGYREGFSDCLKLSNPGRGPVNAPQVSNGTSKKTASLGVRRLRGLPCANCGAASYVDEAQCPSCGTHKAGVTEEVPQPMEQPKMARTPSRRARRQS
jgi:hypothetical protein